MLESALRLRESSVMSAIQVLSQEFGGHNKQCEVGFYCCGWLGELLAEVG